jgi:CubicO group peptidase (beta-lactamase class C family)
MNQQLIWSFLISLVFSFSPLLAQDLQLPTEAEAIAERYVKKRSNQNLVITVWRDGQQITQGFGNVSKDQKVAPTKETRYGLGGMSAIFSTALMDNMASQGRLDMSDPIGLYLPANRIVPNYLPASCVELEIPVPGQPPQRIVRCEADTMAQAICITFCDLASHVAGLGNTTQDWMGWNPISGSIRPGQDPSGPELEAFWTGFEQAELLNAPGRYFYYSNLGIAVLGQTLAELEGVPYSDLFAKQISQPLQLVHTDFSPASSVPTTPPIDEKGKPIAFPTFEALAPAFGVYSNTEDLLAYGKLLFASNSSWQNMLEQTVQPRLDAPFRINREPTQVGYGWFTTRLSAASNLPVHWINGGVPGYRSFFAIQPDTKTIVIILASGNELVDSLGWSILRDL